MKIIDYEIRGSCVRFYLGKDDDTDYHGDDWNDRPYDSNAGTVYQEYITGYADLVFPLDSLVLEPCDGVTYCRFTKDDMKNGTVPCVVVVPAPYANEETYNDFAYWCNHKKAHKFYFNEQMEPTLGPAIYYFNPKLEQFLQDVDTRMVTKYIDATISGVTPMKEVPIWEKANLTLKEAALYFGIGQNKLREMTDMRNCNFVLIVGTKRLIKRKQLEKYLENTTYI